MRVFKWWCLGMVACNGHGGGCLQPHLPDGVQVVVCTSSDDMAPDTGHDWDDEPEWEDDTGWTGSSSTDTGWGWGTSDTGW